MELRHLRYFVCVAEEQNIGRAALRLHISQPPLTRQIQQLEDQIDTQLFRRTTKGVELTDAGRVLYEDARHILGLTKRAVERSHKAGLGVLGRVDVAIFGSGIFGSIPWLLRQFHATYPEVNIVLHNMDKEQQIDALRHRSITVAFNRLMRPVTGLSSEIVLTESLFVAMPSDHSLCARTAITLSELQSQPLVLYPTGTRPSFIDRTHELCREAGFVPQVAHEVVDAVHALALVAIGHSLCLVSDSATHIKLPGVTYRPLYHPGRSSVDLCVIYRDDDQSEILQAFLTSLRLSATESAPTRAQRG